jgi:hypothetical protein
MANTSGNDDTSRHAVYTASDGPNTLSLRIHASGPSTIESSTKVFTVSRVATLQVNDDIRTTPQLSINIQEHGWFSDVVLFTDICRNQPVPTRPGPVFNNWVHDVLATVRTHYSAQWTENYANFV